MLRSVQDAQKVDYYNILVFYLVQDKSVTVMVPGTPVSTVPISFALC